MKKNLVFVSIIFLSVFGLFARDIRVIETVIVPTDESRFTSPQFSPDGEKILFTGFGSKGLWLYDISDKSLVQINNFNGAGYEPKFSSDGRQVIFRVDEYIDMRKYSSLAIQTIGDSKAEFISEKTRFLTPALRLENHQVIAVANENLRTFDIDRKESVKTTDLKDPVVYIEDQKIALIKDNKKQILSPFGQGNYIWPSLSPDRTKILFTFVGIGTAIIDLQGNVLARLGAANAPEWSPDGKWVTFMLDKDDGHAITASDIWALDVESGAKTQLTSTSDRIEMYPAWSPQMDKIAFDTYEGEIGYLLVVVSE